MPQIESNEEIARAQAAEGARRRLKVLEDRIRAEAQWIEDNDAMHKWVYAERLEDLLDPDAGRRES